MAIAMEKSLVVVLGLSALGAFASVADGAGLTNNNAVAWVDDALPAGAQPGADGGEGNKRQ